MIKLKLQGSTTAEKLSHLSMLVFYIVMAIGLVLEVLL